MDGAGAPLIVGITGASGAILGLTALDLARAAGVTTHLIVSRAAWITIGHELGLSRAAVEARADVTHNVQDIGATVASGSYPVRGMLIAPCSVKTMSEIAAGITGTLMGRAADVTLKERRRLVLMVRESPLHLGHLRSMTALTEMGAIIAPPVPAFYANPADTTEMARQMVARALSLFGIESDAAPRWAGLRDQPG